MSTCVGYSSHAAVWPGARIRVLLLIAKTSRALYLTVAQTGPAGNQTVIIEKCSPARKNTKAIKTTPLSLLFSFLFCASGKNPTVFTCRSLKVQYNHTINEFKEKSGITILFLFCLFCFLLVSLYF